MTARTRKAKPVDKATPVIRRSVNTDAAKISATRSVTTVMQGSPLWASTPAIQAANVAWNQAANALEAKAKAVANLRSELATLGVDLQALRRDWFVANRQMMAIVAVHAGTSADQVHGLGFDVRTHITATAQAAPADVTAKPGKASGDVTISWQRGGARHGFHVQHAADVANPATYAQPVPVTRTKYTLHGAQAHSTVNFRVAAIDPIAEGGLSPWSDWVAGTAR
jgi:hypothetical protein